MIQETNVHLNDKANGHFDCASKIEMLEQENKALIRSMKDHEILFAKIANMLDTLISSVEQLAMLASYTADSPDPPKRTH